MSTEKQTRQPDRADARLVTLRKLSKVYHEGDRSHPVFHNIDLDIHQGTFTVLLGRSGSGKSTLLNLISGIDLPTAGEVIVYTDQGEVNLTRLSER